MNRNIFLKKLKEGLVDFSKEDADDVIQFYEELLDEENIKENDEIPARYSVKKIINDFNLNQKIKNWEKEDKGLSRIRKGIPIIALGILSVPSILVIGLIFMVLLVLALAFIAGIYGVIIYTIISTISNLSGINSLNISDIFMLVGILLLVIGISTLIIELVVKLASVIIKKIRRK